MERVVRGLRIADEATQKQDIGELLKGYPEGFNSNMCRAVVRMSKERTIPLEYSVLWSPRLAPSEDLEEIGPICLRERSYDLLDVAYRRLKEMEPEHVKIRGRVTSVGSSGPPLGDQPVKRIIRVLWTSKVGRGQKPHVVIEVERNAYIEAHEAHLKWSTITVTGRLQRIGNEYHLLDPQDFEIVF